MDRETTLTLPPACLARIDNLFATRTRVMLGLAGPPGAGKSTVADALHRRHADHSVVVPMDGFHLANTELRRLGREKRKGAPETFDAAGFVGLLERIRRQRADEIVYAPEFRREIEEPVAGAIPVAASTRLIIVEGNYLLLDEGRWGDVARQLDEVWYIDVDPALRIGRLVDRHVHFGRTRAAAEEWVLSNDEHNARLIESTRPRASYVVDL
jgi:pantothenate kinase